MPYASVDCGQSFHIRTTVSIRGCSAEPAEALGHPVVHVRYAGCVDYARQLQFGAFCAE
ncbi:hypothetical protein HNP00_002497 [Arthrobacter sp. AZCC_0090]|nr:hypothetical protein [Arthrobacter sp. AZCC_0090]